MLDRSILVGTGGSPIGTGFPVADPAVPPAPGSEAVQRDAAVDQAEWRARTLAAAIELLAHLDASENLDAAAADTASLLCQFTSAGRVMILWGQPTGNPVVETTDPTTVGQWSLMADTAADDPQARQSDSRLAIAAGQEVAARDAVTRWPTDSPTGRHALLAVAQLAGHLSADSILAVALPDRHGRPRGVVLVINPSTDAADGQAAFLHAMASPLASRLIGIQRLQPSRLESLYRRFLRGLRARRRKWILSAVAAVCVVMLLPLPYTIRAELELQPIQHRFVAVPFDGPLQSAMVRPGDSVDKGDLLATINPREIEYELAGVRAELNRSLQEKKGFMAQHDVAGSKIAALESQRLQLQTDLLQYRRDNLEIRSPISGVVVNGDWKQSEGMPMSRGETLFEIAPLGRMSVEIAITEEDIHHVRRGMPLDFYVYALPSRTMSGVVARVHPRSELRDHDNVYIAEVQVDDPDNVLRPGMRGRARIRGDRHCLGWNLFHKAYYALRHAAGW